MLTAYQVNHGDILSADPNILEDDCTVEGKEDRSTHCLNCKENAAESKRLQKCLVQEDIKY